MDSQSQKIERAGLLYYDGQAALRNNQVQEALGLFLESDSLYPHFKTSERVYEILSSLGRVDEAFYHIQRAYELNPNNDKTATLYAKELTHKGEINLAKQVLVQILERNKTYGPARKLLSEIGD